jgi:homoserine O-acetyltransferase
MPTREKADRVLSDDEDRAMRAMDANDVIYALESSRDYEPGPKLESITAPLIAVNTADDLINPPDLGILEREIKRVPHGKAITLPESPETRGHGSHTIAKLWKHYLEELLNATERPSN